MSTFQYEIRFFTIENRDMSEQDHKTTYRKDYSPPKYFISDVYLEFDLQPTRTVVKAVSQFIRNETLENDGDNVRLNGENVKLLEIKIDGEVLQENRYTLDTTSLEIIEPPQEFSLEITTEINPEANKALSGLYRSSGNYCTQCEAEGFRRITYYLDRPDVLAKFTTKIIGDKNDNPVLLSNGNLIDNGDINDRQHFCVWQDPFPKPCYLFALVAGDLFCKEGSFTTMSGREVALQIFVEHQNSEKCDHALRSLKKSMKWDEQVYGLQYDLDTYMIVAVDDFNMGAMENKGLNIFNSKYVMSSPNTATDQDYLGVEGVIAHEYFHNWTGNRVTCRDWFQLSLKEGLTVFRDQEFSADMNSRSVQRINDVKILRNNQFREDASPMAHPVRPDSYVEINNFYTVTVYNKGAEVIRMLYKIIGEEAFHRGMGLYFERFDGMAVTCDDFVAAMADASGQNLDQFKHWYSQAGTPEVVVDEEWSDEDGEFKLHLRQNCKPTPGQPKKKPFHIPIEVGLLFTGEDKNGQETVVREVQDILHLKDEKSTFSFKGFESRPVVSLLRQFSAPVKLQKKQTKRELAFLMANDSDQFNRWDAANTLATSVVMDVVEKLREKKEPEVDPHYVEAFKRCLLGEGDAALIAQALSLPAEGYLAQQMDIVEPDLLGKARMAIKDNLGKTLRNELLDVYFSCADDGEYSIDAQSMGKRSLKNCCLAYLTSPGAVSPETLDICVQQYTHSTNMTDVIAALSALANIESAERTEALNRFYQKWKKEPLVVDKWLMIQASSTLESTLENVKKLTEHESFSYDNPNKIRSLIGAFCSFNHYRFHEESGAGYRFLARNIIAIDKNNPQIAARLVSPMISYAKYSQKLKVLMEEQLSFILQQKNISADVYEIVQKSLS